MGECCVCIAEFDLELEPMFALREREEWKDRKRTATCTAAEFQKMYFRESWLWRTFFRAIIPVREIDEDGDDSSGRRQQFLVSGVGQAGFWVRDHKTPCIVPWDKDIVKVGRQYRCPSTNTPIYDPDYHGNKHQVGEGHLKPHGYIIHERCWDLVQRVIGKSIIEENLDIFVKTLHQRIRDCTWSREPWTRIYGLGNDSDSSWYEEALAEVPAEDFFQNPSRCIQIYKERDFRGKPRLFSRDPLNIIELRDLIDEAIQRLSQMKFTESSLIIPLDIQLIIVEDLDDPQDILNTLSAFRWHLPNSYWQARFPKDEVFEFERLINIDLDWAYLCLGVEILFKTSHGLRTRLKILECIKCIQHDFWEMVKFQKKDCEKC